ALAGGTPVLVPARSDLHWDPAELRRAVAGARLVVFSNPCNPTGVVHTRTELDELADMLAGTETLVLADEAYDHIVFDAGRFTSALEHDGLRERTVYCQTLSKTYAMTGWRLGYLAGPGEVIAAAARIHRTVNGSVNAAVQRAGLAAVSEGEEFFAGMLDSYRRRRDLLVAALSGIDGLRAHVPDGTFYIFVAYRLPIPAVEFAAELGRAGVAVRAGSEYGPSGEGHFRLSFAAGEETIAEAARRIEKFMAERRD
ncbi:MAG: pyridoxal phosphate-dependent aminotransferase, partial [Stackebrandtia sp.]